MVENPPTNADDKVVIPGLGRFPHAERQGRTGPQLLKPTP